MFIIFTFPYLFFIDVRERAKRDLERGEKPENRNLGYQRAPHGSSWSQNTKAVSDV
jgi:hypothetical protein